MYDWKEFLKDVKEARARYGEGLGECKETHVFADMDNFIGIQFTYVNAEGKEAVRFVRLRV